MKNKMKLVTVATFVVAAAMTFAQGGGGMRMMGGPGGGSMSMLLIRDDVKKEIKLTDEQSSKLDEMRTAMQEEMRGKFQGGGGGGDREAMMKEVGEMIKKADKDTLALLDDAQKKRLKELWIQKTGNGIVTNEEIQKELGFTDAQKARVKELTAAQSQANQEIFQKMRDGEIDRSEIRPLMEKNTKTLNEELGKVITAEQAGKLKTMGGAAFKFDEDSGN